MRNRYYPFAGRGIPADAKCSFDNPTGADTLPSHLKVHALRRGAVAVARCRSLWAHRCQGRRRAFDNAAYRSRLGTGTAVRCGSWQGNAAPGSDVMAAAWGCSSVLVRERRAELVVGHTDRQLHQGLPSGTDMGARRAAALEIQRRCAAFVMGSSSI
jgi:hypothetical protein